MTIETFLHLLMSLHLLLEAINRVAGSLKEMGAHRGVSFVIRELVIPQGTMGQFIPQQEEWS